MANVTEEWLVDYQDGHARSELLRETALTTACATLYRDDGHILPPETVVRVRGPRGISIEWRDLDLWCRANCAA